MLLVLPDIDTHPRGCFGWRSRGLRDIAELRDADVKALRGACASGDCTGTWPPWRNEESVAGSGVDVGQRGRECESENERSLEPRLFCQCAIAHEGLHPDLTRFVVVDWTSSLDGVSACWLTLAAAY